MDRFEVSSSRCLSAGSAHHHAIAESVRFKSALFHSSTASEKAEPAFESPPGDDPPMGSEDAAATE